MFRIGEADLWERLPKSGVFVTPTDTVLGFGCLREDSEAVSRIRLLKRSFDSRFITLVRSVAELKTLAQVDAKQTAILEKNWPGAITFILKGIEGGSTLAFRLPDFDFILKLMAHLGGPILSTSCNLHNEPTLTSVQKAQEVFGAAVDAYVEGPQREQPLKASTVVDLTSVPPKILRQGDLSPKL